MSRTCDLADRLALQGPSQNRNLHSAPRVEAGGERSALSAATTRKASTPRSVATDVLPPPSQQTTTYDAFRSSGMHRFDVVSESAGRAGCHGTIVQPPQFGNSVSAASLLATTSSRQHQAYPSNTRGAVTSDNVGFRLLKKAGAQQPAYLPSTNHRRTCN